MQPTNKIIRLLLLITIQSTAVYSQTGVYNALNIFLGTEFFDQFEGMRKQAEDAVIRFDLVKHKYRSEDVQLIIDSYNSSAEYFNMTLYNIKNDLLDKHKRKYIINYPESYSKQVETDLRRAEEFYRDTFQKEIAELTEGEITGSALLLMIPEIIKYVKLGIEVIKKVKNEINKFNEAILNKHLIEKYRFRTWDEVVSQIH